MQDEFELEIITMAHGGRGLGRHDNKVIFVPYTIPGETVVARVTEDKDRIAFAEGVTLLESSVDRVYPHCPHFGPGRCGGCQWQHINYEAQLLIKQDIVADQLARIGKLDDSIVENVLHSIIGSPKLWNYNKHMTFSITAQGEIGMPMWDENNIAIIEECHILNTELLALFGQLDMDFDGVQRIRLQIGDDNRHMLIMFVNDEENMPELSTDLTTSVNVILPDNEPVNLIGDTHTRYQIKERSFRVTAGSYIRANTEQIDRLIDVIVSQLDTTAKPRILDLFGGVGILSAFVAENAELVTLIESYPPTATDAEENLADFDNIDIIEGSVEDVFPELEEAFDIAILDPPSNGLSTDLIDLIEAMQIDKLIYVSDDPATLARDVRRLMNKGYHLSMIQPIDFAPHTYYITCVGVLELTNE